MATENVRVASVDVVLRSVLHALGIVVAAFVVGIALGVFGIVVLGVAGYTQESHPVLVNATGTVLQFVGFILTVAGYVVVFGERDLIPVRAPRVGDVAWMIAGFVGVFVAAYAVGVVVTILELETAENVAISAGQENPDLFLYLIPIAVLLVGPGEELVFRGVVQGQLKRAFGPVPAILLASVLFGAVHVVALTGAGRLVYVAIAGALGLVLGVVYEKSDNILVPSVVHGLWNAMLFAINWYVVVYDVQLPG